MKKTYYLLLLLLFSKIGLTMEDKPEEEQETQFYISPNPPYKPLKESDLTEETTETQKSPAPLPAKELAGNVSTIATIFSIFMRSSQCEVIYNYLAGNKNVILNRLFLVKKNFGINSFANEEINTLLFLSVNKILNKPENIKNFDKILTVFIPSHAKNGEEFFILPYFNQPEHVHNLTNLIEYLIENNIELKIGLNNFLEKYLDLIKN